MSQSPAGFVLPVSIISPTDVARLKRELDAIDGYFQQAQIREGGQQQPVMPRLSKLMDQLAVENKLNLLQEDHREYVLKSLEVLTTSAPVLHISFSVDPPGSYVQKIVYWLRANVHAQVLVTVGLQPNIGAGCVVRTTNRIFDFSLREYFNAKRDFFIEKMHEAISEQPITQAAAQTVSEAPVVATIPVPSKTQAVNNSVPNVAQPVADQVSDQKVELAVTKAPEVDAHTELNESAETKIAVNVVASSGGPKS